MKFPQNRFNSFLNGSSLKMPWEVPSHKFSKRADFYQGKFREFFGETTQKVLSNSPAVSWAKNPQLLPQLSAVLATAKGGTTCWPTRALLRSKERLGQICKTLGWIPTAEGGEMLMSPNRKNSGLVNIFHTLKKICCFWTYTCMQAWVHVCIHKCWIYVYMYVDICAHICVQCTCMCTYMCAYERAYMCTYMCPCICTFMWCVCTYVCTYMHMWMNMYAYHAYMCIYNP